LKIILENKKRNKILRELPINIIDSIPELFILINASDWTILQLNKAMAKSLGKTREELLGKNILKFFPPDVAEIRKKQAEKVIRTGKSVYFEDKREGRWFENAFHPAFDSKGKVAYGVIVVHEITNRKLAEKALDESEERFRMISDQSLLGIIIIQDNKIQYLNNAMLNLTGYSKEEILKEGINIISKTIHPDHRSFVLDQLRKKQEGNKDVVIHYPIKTITKKGKIRWLDVFSKTVIYNGRNADFATYIDITDTKNAQDELKNTKEYLQDVINSASDLILVVDKNLKITTWNKTTEMITGYKSREVIGKSIKTLDLFESIDSILDFFNEESREQEFSFFELYLKTKKGSRKILKVTFSKMQSGTKDMKSVLIMGKDITKDSEVHGKLVFGNCYMIIEKTNNSAINLFNDLVTLENNGLFITRDTPETIQSYIPLNSNINVIVLNQEKLGGFDNVFDLDALTLKIDKFLKTKSKPIILLDRVDYLLTYFSFDAFIKTLYKIANLVVKKKGLLFLRLNPSVISENQLALFREELKQLPSQTIRDVQLEDYMYDVLGFINEENQNNTIVTYKKISQRFSISKVTTAKRLDKIKEKGLIIIKKQGKSKNIYISEKGKILLNKKKII